MNPNLVDFYSGAGTDHAGRTLIQVLAFDADALEYTHDYIQWLFPNRDASRFNNLAPLLTDGDVEQFKKSPFLMARLKQSLELMRKFYKIDIGVPYWWDDHRYSHNWLRMTRILHCLREFGLHEQAESFHSAIDKSKLPDARTRSFWFTAAGKPTSP
jgi:Opioid growth factor receptor (OGFr) conserved region